MNISDLISDLEQFTSNLSAALDEILSGAVELKEEMIEFQKEILSKIDDALKCQENSK